jgi:hypothetical protein
MPISSGRLNTPRLKTLKLLQLIARVLRYSPFPLWWLDWTYIYMSLEWTGLAIVAIQRCTEHFIVVNQSFVDHVA